MMNSNGTAGAMAIAGGAIAAAEVSEHGIGRASSGRTRLVSVTGHVIANHPVAGVGIGSQPLAAKEELDTRRRASKNASHTTPLTVLAELDAIAATVIGGTSLTGGIGRIGGTVIGMVILGIMTSGFTFLGVDVYYQYIVKGVIIVAAVAADMYRQQKRKV